jgi:shikimate dehydrogenase
VTPTASTRVAAVIGTPIRHSLSPALYNAAYAALELDWVFVAFDVARGHGEDAVRAARTLGLVGLAVTMPHKQAAARVCDELTDDAAALQAANSVRVADDGRLVGDSTDGEGFRRAMVEAGHDPLHRHVLVLGAGGAARAVARTLGGCGSDVTVAARRSDAAEAAAALAPGGRAASWADLDDLVPASDVIVDATPIGMGLDADIAFDPGLLRPSQVVADLVYEPLETPLLAAARARGAATVDGLGMLVQQAALQVERWTGRPAPVAAMYAAARHQLDR